MPPTPTTLSLIILLQLSAYIESACVHDHFSSNISFHFYDDLSEGGSGARGRLLQVSSNTMQKLRVFVDYGAVRTGGITEKNMIKRIMNISANYFYNILKVQRLQKLLYPSNLSKKCNILTIPNEYITKGVTGDLGILVSNQASATQYIAKSTSCALLKSNNRPIWGIMIWNNNFLEFDQVGFQKIVYVGLHEMVHVLGFSAALYEKFPLGNPFRNDSNAHYLTSGPIIRQMRAHFNCSNPKGIILEDQDGTLIASHNEKKVFGNQFMAASGKKGSYFSRFTLALLQSTGWYEVDYMYTEPTTWGKGKGCDFLDIDDCKSEEFCTGTNFDCDWEMTAIGRCNQDPFTGSCKLTNYFTNTICTDENYELKNLNSGLATREKGGHNSRCFSSDFRQKNLEPNILNFRCYTSFCSISKNFLYILVDGSVLSCPKFDSSRNQAPIKLNAPVSSNLSGTLTCPEDFTNYCDGVKKTCAYNCNKNGICINGMCLCTGSLKLTSTCLDTALTITQIDQTGVLTKSILQIDNILILSNTSTPNSLRTDNSLHQNSISKAFRQGRYTIQETKKLNSESSYGTFRDQFGEIVLCERVFGCLECTREGCVRCPAGWGMVEGRCMKV